MKSLSVCLLFLSSVGFAAAAKSNPAPTAVPADNVSTMTLGGRLTPDDPAKVSKGLRTAILVPTYETRVDVTLPVKANGKVESQAEGVGLFIGYADIPVRDFGFLGGMTWAKSYLRRDAYQVVRLESNLTYGLTKQLYGRWGAHVHKYVETPIDLKSNFGLQAGFGFQLNRTLGAELTAVYMAQSGGERGAAYDAKTTGFDLGITGTF